MSTMITEKSLSLLCADCGRKGVKALAITLQSLLKSEAKKRVGDGPYRFCESPECDTVYYSENSKEFFTKADLSVRVGIKETEAPRHVCYCFNHTIEEIDDEVRRKGHSAIPEDIKTRMKEACWCETMSPRGSCCLGTVNRYVREALDRFDKPVETAASSVDTGLSTCCQESGGESSTGSKKKQWIHPCSRWVSRMAGLLAIGLSLLPILSCPACWPAYTALLSALGLGFLWNSTYLLPLMILFLCITLFGLAFRARQRRGLWPFAVGVLGSGAILGGKVLLNSTPLLYVGVALVIGASFWNSWPRKKVAACPACVTAIPEISLAHPIK